MKLKTIIATIFILIITIFSLQNSDVTDVKFLNWDLRTYKVLVILGSFLIGILVGLLLSVTRKYTKSKKQKLEAKKKEIDQKTQV